jgi:hypothetical protein
MSIDVHPSHSFHTFRSTEQMPVGHGLRNGGMMPSEEENEVKGKSLGIGAFRVLNWTSFLKSLELLGWFQNTRFVTGGRLNVVAPSSGRDLGDG